MDNKLYEAAKSGDMESLNRLLQEKPDILMGETPLMETVCHVALRHEQLEFAFKAYTTNLMLRTRQSAKGEYLLHWALKMNKEEFFLRCIQREGLAPSSSSYKPFQLGNREGKSLLFLAVEMGSLRAVKSLLESSFVPTSFQESSFVPKNCGPNNSTALHAAIFQPQNDHEILRKVLRKFPELINAQDGGGNTPLHHAVSSNKEQYLLQLLQDDSTAYILNYAGFAPIHLSASLGNLQVFERLLELSPESVWLATNRNKNVLHLSVEMGNANIVQAIIERPELKELLYEKDTDGNTCLHMAASIGDQDMQQILIEMEENSIMPVIKNRQGLTVAELQKKRRQAKEAEAEVEMEREREKKLTEIRAQRKSRMGHLKILLVVDTLLVTVAYSAVFNVPGGFGDDGSAVLTRSSKFVTFMVLNTLTFTSSILALGWAVLSFFSHDILRPPSVSSFFRRRQRGQSLFSFVSGLMEPAALSAYACALLLTYIAYFFLLISYAFGVIAMAGKVVHIRLLVASGYLLPIIFVYIISFLFAIKLVREGDKKFRNM